MPTPVTFWPQTLVDYAQILAAIGTTAAVIVSLWLASRKPRPSLRASVRLMGTVVPNHPEIPQERLLDFAAANIGPMPIKITAIGWHIKRWLWKKPLTAVQMIERSRMTAAPPVLLAHGEETSFYIKLVVGDTVAPWLKETRDKGFFPETIKTRRDMERLRGVFATSVGSEFRVKPSKELLDLIWDAHEVFQGRSKLAQAAR